MPVAGERKQILLLDDSPFFLNRLRDLLATMGYAITECSKARAAQEFLERESGRVDLVIVDLKMPEVDGFEFLRWLRARPWGPGLKVLVLTGAYELDEIIQPLRALGVLGLMDKGSHPHHILTRVNAVIYAAAGQARRFERVACSLPVNFTYGSLRKEALITHIGVGGCFLATDEIIPEDASIEVNLQLPGASRIHHIPGRLVWVMGGQGWEKVRSAIKGMGVEWSVAPGEALNEVREFIDKRRAEEKLYDLAAP